MRTDLKSNISGIQVFELTCAFHQGPSMKAGVSYLTSDGVIAGKVNIPSGWSEEVLKALLALAEAVEEDIIQRSGLFEPDTAGENDPELLLEAGGILEG